MNNEELQQFPLYLRSYEEMLKHFDAKLGDMRDVDKGESFENFAINTIPFSTIGKEFEEPARIKKEKGHQSQDGGCDLIAESIDGQKTLFIQAKYKIYRADTLDTIIQRLFDFSRELELEEESTDKVSQLSLSLPEISKRKEFHYVIFTLNDISGIIQSFEKRTRGLYKTLKDEERIHLIYGSQILDILRSAYRKAFTVPANIELQIVKDQLICVENDSGKVYISVVLGSQLKQCYDDHLESIFFENIREFLGPKSGRKNEDREGVNRAIEKTLQEEPEKMLAKNNGVTFRAEKVEKADNKLILSNASIVNGCQTTMSLVHNPSDKACVLVKVVEVGSGNSWDIAKSANYQNPVDLIRLDLARYIRPQVIKKAAATTGMNLNFDDSEIGSESSILKMMASINQESGKYEAIYSLFISFFSLSATNAISNLYTKLREGILEDFYNDLEREDIFRILAKLNNAADVSTQELERIYEGDGLEDVTLVQRFLNPKKDNYRALITVLAACGCEKENIYNPNRSYLEIVDFLKRIEAYVETNIDGFMDYFTWAFQSILSVTDVEKDGKINAKDLNQKIARAKFDNLYNDIRRQAAMDSAMKARKGK